MDVIGNNLFKGLSDSERKTLLDKCCVEEQIAIEENTVDIAYEGVVQTIAELSKFVPLFIVSNCQSGYIELVMKKIILLNIFVILNALEITALQKIRILN